MESDRKGCLDTGKFAANVFGFHGAVREMLTQTPLFQVWFLILITVTVLLLILLCDDSISTKVD